MKRKILLFFAMSLIYSEALTQSLRKPNLEEDFMRNESPDIQKAIADIGYESSLEMRLTYNVPFVYILNS